MIMVTGATGFVGRSLMALLRRQERPVKAYGGRMNSPLVLRVELPGVQTVIHLAGAEASGRPRLVQHVDVEGTERLVEECRRAGVQHIILLSRLGADPNSIYPLLRAKGEAERIVRHSGIPYTILRSATLFGRYDRFLNVIVSLAVWSWPFVWLPGGGGLAMQPLWVEDLVRCLADALDRPGLHGRTLELAGEERFRYAELARVALEAAGLRRIPLPIHLRLVRPTAMALLAWWPRPPVNRFTLDRFSVPDVAELDSVRRHFGFRAALLRENIAYLRRPGLARYIFVDM